MKKQPPVTVETPKTTPPFIIGIICNGYNDEDLAYYNAEFKLINKLFKDKVKLMFVGYNPENSTALDGVDYEYTKPVSINHFFRHMHALKVNLLFIPLIQNTFNVTSENYNKFTEAAFFGIPVITVDQYPYNEIINDKSNGYLYANKEEFIQYLKDILINHLPTVQQCGLNAYETYLQELCYIPSTLNVLHAVFE